MLPRNYYPTLLPNVAYHIYNRGNNRNNVFYQERNYTYFLSKYKTYIAPYVDTYAYCLLPNHIHFLIRIKGIDVFIGSEAFMKRHSQDFPSFQNLGSLIHSDPRIEARLYAAISTFISEQFRRFFMSYAKAINKQEGRTGSLFQKKFKRLLMEDEDHFSALIYYIHANPALHGIYRDFKNYPHSSFRAFLSDAPTLLLREEVLSQFGSKDQFSLFHDQYFELKSIEKWIIEESGVS